jgi:hypothetical protein
VAAYRQQGSFVKHSTDPVGLPFGLLFSLDPVEAPDTYPDHPQFALHTTTLTVLYDSFQKREYSAKYHIMACISNFVPITVTAGACGTNVPATNLIFLEAPLATPQSIISVQATASGQATGIQPQSTATNDFVATIQTAFFASNIGPQAACPTKYSVGPITLCQNVHPMQTSQTHSSPKTISNGDIAGVGIGCAIAGALIALVPFLLFSRHRNRRSPRTDKEDYSYGADAGAGVVGSKKSAMTSLSFEKGSAAEIVESNLPQPLGDSVLQDDFGKIGDKIDGHVQSFYNTDAAVDPRAVAQTIAQALGEESPYSMSQIVDWLENPYARAGVLRFAVAFIILLRVRLECDSGISFLPPPLPACIQSISQTKTEDKGTSQEIPSQLQQGLNNTPVRMAFLSKWKTISASLFHSTHGQTSMPESDARITNIRKATALADSVLRPYAKAGEDHQSRLQNLEEIMRRAARFAYVLFAQPSFYTFEWQAMGKGLVVFPALVQVTDENGTMLRQPRVFVEASSVKV